MSNSSLTDWSKSSINALLESSLPEPPNDSQNIAQRAFVEDPNVTFNHSPLSFQDFKAELGARFGAAAGIQIDWKDCFEDVVSVYYATLEPIVNRDRILCRMLEYSLDMLSSRDL